MYQMHSDSYWFESSSFVSNLIIIPGPNVYYS